jgi:hypothetical protein
MYIYQLSSPTCSRKSLVDLEVDEWPVLRPEKLNPGGTFSVRIEQDTEWAPEWVWKLRRGKSLPNVGNRTLARPAERRK